MLIFSDTHIHRKSFNEAQGTAFTSRWLKLRWLESSNYAILDYFRKYRKYIVDAMCQWYKSSVTRLVTWKYLFRFFSDLALFGCNALGYFFLVFLEVTFWWNFKPLQFTWLAEPFLLFNPSTVHFRKLYQNKNQLELSFSHFFVLP